MRSRWAQLWIPGLAVLLLGSCGSSPDDETRREAGVEVGDAGLGGGDTVETAADLSVDTVGDGVGTKDLPAGDERVSGPDGLAGPDGLDVTDTSAESGGPSSVPCGSSVCGTSLEVNATRMVYDAARTRLYVSIRGGANRYPNTITTIDPSTAAVTASIPIGSDPNALGLSDDGSTLWVGMDGSFSMRKVTLTATPPIVGPLRRIPPGQSSAEVIVRSLVPLSDSPDAIGGLMTAGPSLVAVYDDGVVRGAAPMPVAGSNPTSLAKGPPGLFFGANEESLFLLSVSSGGLNQTMFRDLVSGTGGGMFYAQNRVYVGSAVIDVSNRTAPVRIGTFAFAGRIARHSPTRVIMLSPPELSLRGDSQWELRLLDTETFSQKGSVKIPRSLLSSSFFDEDSVSDLVYLGGDVLALIATSSGTKSSRVLLLRAPMLANDGVEPTGGADGGTGVVGRDGGTGDTGSGDALPGALCAGCTLQKIDVPAFRMIYDSPRSRLYTVSTYDAAQDKNTLTSIDATTGNVLAKVPIGQAARHLALSDDGATLWIGFDESRSLHKFSVINTPPVPGAGYPLPPPMIPDFLDTRAYDLVALPGTPTSIAVSLTGGSSGVAILDDGIARPTIDDSDPFISKLASGLPGVLFGYDGTSSGHTFASYAVSTSGVTLLSAQKGLMGVFQNDIHYHQGRVYADLGEVIDVADPAKPSRIGKFAFAGSIAARSPDRMLMLTAGGAYGPAHLRILETANFTQVAALSLGAASSNFSSLLELVYLGGDGVAFVSSSKNVYIFRSPALATVP